MHDTIANLGYKKRSRIESGELLSDEEILNLPATLRERDLDGVLASQVGWRSKPNYQSHLLTLLQKQEEERSQTDQSSMLFMRRFKETLRQFVGGKQQQTQGVAVAVASEGGGGEEGASAKKEEDC